jgi:catechol 2,3-dioxygenase
MPSAVAPQLTHMAVFARDLPAMEAFYADILGLVVSDQGSSANLGVDLVFMTADPDKHHQFVLVSGRSPDAVGNVQQVSFLVNDLATLRQVHDRAVAAGVATPRCVTHGNAFSTYFPDPEGNTIEVYCDTPWYVPQPFGVPIDLGRPDAELAAENEALCRATPGFLPRAEWQAGVAARIRARLAERRAA